MKTPEKMFFHPYTKVNSPSQRSSGSTYISCCLHALRVLEDYSPAWPWPADQQVACLHVHTKLRRGSSPATSGVLSPVRSAWGLMRQSFMSFDRNPHQKKSREEFFSISNFWITIQFSILFYNLSSLGIKQYAPCAYFFVQENFISVGAIGVTSRQINVVGSVIINKTRQQHDVTVNVITAMPSLARLSSNIKSHRFGSAISSKTRQRCHVTANEDSAASSLATPRHNQRRLDNDITPRPTSPQQHHCQYWLGSVVTYMTQRAWCVLLQLAIWLWGSLLISIYGSKSTTPTVSATRVHC
jgi:hypothetical protein